jgi:uncharacterized protein
MSTGSKHHRRLLLRVWARNIHIYISMMGLLAVVFFSVTGIMLNHDEWFSLSDPRITKKDGTLPATMLREPDKLAIVEALRKDFGATGALDSFDIQNDSLELVFKSPGRRTEATIDRATGHAEVTVESHGFNGRIAELHRGTDAGPAWRLVIDATAILLLITSLTGITLWFLVPKWRPLGLAAMAVCLVACLVVYLLFVP